MRRLKSHSGSHIQSKAFKCDECDKDYKTVYDLRKHSIIHEDNRISYHCSSSGCTKYYSLSVLTAVKKARLTSEFIYLARVLSNPQIPYQALTTKQFNTNKENYRGCNEDKTFTFILNLSFPFPLGCQSKVYGF